MEVPVKNQSGDTIDTIDLNDEVFNVAMNHTLVHQALVIYQGNKRQGTHATKTRSQVSGGGRKPWIQKHTGRARQGSTRAPQWRHGGVVFGPHPREHRKALPTRMRRQAVKCVLSEKARRGNLICIDSMDTVDGRTRSMTSLLENLGITGSALVVTQEGDSSVVQAAHNLKGIWTLPLVQLNANDLLRRQTLVMTLAAAHQAEEIWNTVPGRGQRRNQIRANALAVAATASEEAAAVEPASSSQATPGNEEAAAVEPASSSQATPGNEATPGEETPPPAPRPRRRRPAGETEGGAAEQ